MIKQYAIQNPQKEHISCTVYEIDEKGNFKTNQGIFGPDMKGRKFLKGYKLVELTDEIEKAIENLRLKKDETFFLRDNPLIPEPNRYFQIGDIVTVNLQKEPVVVVESFDEGKYYLVASTSDKTANPTFQTWLELFPQTDTSEKMYIRSKVKFETFNIKISTLLFHYYKSGINMDPEYQRGYVWDQEDKVDLIDSIMNDIEIGRFSFILIPVTETLATNFTYEVLDGKQRLRAILDFYEDKFTYRGRKYSELSESDRRDFLNHNTAMLTTSENMTLAEKYKHFYTINKKGRVMGKDHLDYVNKKAFELLAIQAGK